MAASNIVFTKSESGRVPIVQLTTRPSKQSIIGERYTLPAGITRPGIGTGVCEYDGLAALEIFDKGAEIPKAVRARERSEPGSAPIAFDRGRLFVHVDRAIADAADIQRTAQRLGDPVSLFRRIDIPAENM